MNRNRLGRDFFGRGDPELEVVDRRNEYTGTLYDLLTAYASLRQRQAVTNVRIEKRGVWSLKEAREVLSRMIGTLRDWTALDSFLLEYLSLPGERASAMPAP